MAILVYLLKTTAVFVTLFSLYHIFLKNVTFLRLRRWYLISTLFLSFLIPWVSPLLLPKYYHSEPGSVLARIDEAVRRFGVTSRLTEPWGNNLTNILVISVLGAVFILVTAKYAFTLKSMYRFLKDSRLVSKNEQYTLRTGNKGEGSFCFLKTIYLCGPSLNEQNLHIILEHEKAHIRQKHYIDLWLSAMCDYFFWFCPFAKQFQAAWEEVLECLADREAIRTLQIEPITYQSVLYSHVEYSGMSTTFNNGFGRSMIARRLLFISRKPVSVRRILPRLCFSFVVAGMLTVALAFVDVRIFQLRKINEIRSAGYDLHEVITGYVLDSDTKKPVIDAIVRGSDAIAVTDGDGFFFIEKTSSALSVQHIAYDTMWVKDEIEMGNHVIKMRLL
jgi:hypothetical protein